MFPDVTKLTFQEEKNWNNPVYSFRDVMQRYRDSYSESLGHGLYTWDTFKFANTASIQEAANFFKRYGHYCPIDPKDELEWNEWWDREEYRRINGITLNIRVPEGGANSDKDLLPLWIPGVYYGHLNYGPIRRVKDDSDLSVEDNLKNAIDIAERQNKQHKLEDLFQGLSDKAVAKKTQSFPDFWDGHFHTYLSMEVAEKLGMDAGMFKSRRKGFSYIGGWRGFNIADMYPQTTVILVAYDLKYLNKGRGLFKMVKEYSSFINLHTEWKKRTLVNNETELVFGFKDKEANAVRGYQSEILAVSAADNPDVTRGKDPVLILWEECGTFPNLLATIEATSAALEAGGYTVGQNLYWGTAGSEEADYDGLATLFYNPMGYNLLPFDNIYDRNKKGTPCALFFGQYQNYERAMDKDGNSDYAEAERLFKIADNNKKKHSRKTDYDKWRAERAVTPKDGLARRGDNIFSVYADTISEQIDILSYAPEMKSRAREGTLEMRGERVVFVSNMELKHEGREWHPPLEDANKFLPKGFDMHGCIIEYDTPFMVEVSPGYFDVPPGLYYAWHDPYATDKTTKDITINDSIGAAYIYEAVNGVTPSRGDRIVASWLGRPSTTDAYNNLLLLLLKRWNAQMMFENDRGDVIPFFRNKKATRYLMTEPEMLSMKEIAGLTGRNYGVSIQKHPLRKQKGVLMFRDHCASTVTNNGLGTRTFIHDIPCKRLLREMLAWNKDGNFDCVSACIVGMYQIREKLEYELKLPDLLTGNKPQTDFWSKSFF